MTTTAMEMVDCRACKGQGGTFEDRWSDSSGHYTTDTGCEACEGTGQVEARCECGEPAVGRDADGMLMCAECRDEGSRIVLVEDRTPTAPEGVPVTMEQLITSGAR